MQLGSPVRYLLVDLDGTLLGNRNFPLSLSFIRNALRELRPYLGLRRALATLWGIRKIFRIPSLDRTNDLRVVDFFSKNVGMPIEQGRELLRDQLFRIFPPLQRYFFPIPGARIFLDWAKDRYPMTLATNPVWPTEIIELRVKWAGIDPTIFRSMTDVRRMHACKPAPEYYREILQQENLRPEECLLIGDNVRMDLPASRVGIRVFIVGNYKNPRPLLFPGAQAPAWRGSFDALRMALEVNQQKLL